MLAPVCQRLQPVLPREPCPDEIKTLGPPCALPPFALILDL